MKNKHRYTIYKGMFLIFVLFSLYSNAQSLTSFNCEEEVEQINSQLNIKTPFILKSDTVYEEVSYIVNTLYFIRNSDTLTCFIYGDATECLDGVSIVKYKNTNVYIVYFYEMLVGYNYCIIVREDLMKVYKTDIFNLNEDFYDVDFETIDFNRKRIKATNVDNPKKTKYIRFKKH